MTPTAAGSLDRLFSPASIAVVGASASPGKLGGAMFKAVRGSADNQLAVFGVNPTSSDDVFVPSLRDATEAHGRPLDLAVLCVPAAAAPEVLRQAGDCGVGAAVVCSGGFAEAGSNGRALQHQLAEIGAATGVRVLGPNTSGFFRTGGATVSFVPRVGQLRDGPVAVVAASGGMNHALAFLLSEAGTGVTLGVGLGNSVDVTAVEVLDYLSTDDSVAAIAVHLESVGDGQSLLSTVRSVSAHKPIVALVVGRTDVSSFAQSHSGALATSWRTTRSLLAEAGAVVVDSERELVDALAVLSRTRLAAFGSSSPGIGLVTAQAGPGLLVFDQLQAQGIHLPELAPSTQASLGALLPPMTFQANPVDTGRPTAAFAQVLAATAADTAIDALAIYALAEADAVDVVDAVRSSGICSALPVVVGVGGDAHAILNTTTSAEAIGLPVLSSPTALANGVRALVQDARAQRVNCQAPNGASATGYATAISLPIHEAAAKDILDTLAIVTPPRRVCADRAAAHRALRELRLPVAVKILDATRHHKTEIGGVHLGVGSHEELDMALDALDTIPAPAYLLETMAAGGVDLIVGARRDPTFGPIILAGLGGIAAEALVDVAIRSHAVSHAGAAAMLDELLCAALLDGWRGGPTLNRAEFASIVVSLAGFLAAHPEIGDIEINPLRCTADGLVALDATIVAAPHHGTRTEGAQQ